MKLKKYQLKRTKSTNDVAVRKIKAGINNGIVITETQTKGRGQYGNKWISFKGNLLMSIFFEVKNNTSLRRLTIKNCQIIKQSVQNLTKYKIKIKPPNDLLINKEKICGILQETLFFNQKKFLIVGIGLNLVKSPKIKNYYTNYLNNYASKKVSKLMAFRSIKDLYEKKIKYLK
jgi:BirA family biotin operon repressor/biotin-[acetyl-CoA-carboxylase] ligase